MQAQLRIASLPSTRCAICSRALSDPDSVRRGIGPICVRKHRNDDAADGRFTDSFLPTPLREGVVIRRNNGAVQTNIPRLVVHHSPSGFEFGYGGSGPSDLALNILENVLMSLGHKGRRIPCFAGRCFELAWRLHQDFKWEFIAGMDRDEGATIPHEMVVNWIAARAGEPEAA